MRFAVALLLTACTAAEFRADMGASADMAVANDLAGADLTGADLTPEPDLAWTDLAGGVDIATPRDMTQPPDLKPPCGGPSEACCPGNTCDQSAANTYGWYGSVCNAGVCTHCGGIAGNMMGTGNGELCCDVPQSAAACIPGTFTCTSTVDGPRCL